MSTSTQTFSSEERDLLEEIEERAWQYVFETKVTPVVIAYHIFEGTEVNLDDNKFLLYNDKGEWATYSFKRFKPV